MVRAGKGRQLPAGNGSEELVDGHGRLGRARRYHHITHAIIADQGGADQCSEGRQQLIRRFAAAAVLAEHMEAQLVRGEQIDITAYALLISILVRIAQCIGIDRLVKNTRPRLHEYLAAKEMEVAK